MNRPTPDIDAVARKSVADRASLPTLTRNLLALSIGAALLSACGGGGGSDTSTATTNNPPTVDAGSDQAVNEGTNIQLDGQGSDPDGGTVTFQWSQRSGPTVTFGDATDPTTTIDVPEVPVLNADPAVLELHVTDAQGASSADIVSINIASTDAVYYVATAAVTRYDPDRATATTLSGPLVSGGEIISGALSPDGDWFAYIADQDTDDVAELYVAATDGSGNTKVSGPLQPEGDVRGPIRWSPDSTQIAYVADAERDEADEVFLVNVDGTDHRKVSGPIGNPATVELGRITWSPDGRYLAQLVTNLASGSIVGINTYDTQNPGSVRVTRRPLTNETLSLVYRWAPDSSRLSYEILFDDTTNPRNNRLYTVRPDGSDIVQIADYAASGGSGGYSYALDTSQLAYIRFAPGLPAALNVTAPDGSDNTAVVTAPAVGDALASVNWSPDGSRIAYRAFFGAANSEVYVVRPDGADNIRVNMPMTPGGNASFVIWSPDSRQITYVADAITDDQFELFAVNADGSNHVRVSGPMPPNGDVLVQPSWSPDGSRIYYGAEQDDEDITEIYTVRPDASENFKVNRPLPPGTEATFASWSLDSSALTYATVSVSGERALDLASAAGMNQITLPGSDGAASGKWAP